jgi:hypothetical protein
MAELPPMDPSPTISTVMAAAMDMAVVVVDVEAVVAVGVDVAAATAALPAHGLRHVRRRLH